MTPFPTVGAGSPYTPVLAPVWGALTGSPNVGNGDNRLERSTAAPFTVFNVAQRAGVQLPAGPPLVHCLAALSVNGDLPFASLAASRVLPFSSPV
ncbi:hypothetical protein [Providencia rettgeri]|uniref:hypothetical protein n=1 Tax=Providencia rettgeri TaxID=587 RepID=UPI00235DF590|nr:hypothetical protein [Providencia rettgeri]